MDEKPKKILVTLDGSEVSEQILHPLESLIGNNSELHLLRVVFVHKIAEMDQIEAQVSTVEDAEKYLKKVEDTLRGKGRKVESHIRYGHAATEILEHIEKGGFDLVAMATHGFSGVGIGRWVLGSTAEKVIRNSPIPVLVIRAA